MPYSKNQRNQTEKLPAGFLQKRWQKNSYCLLSHQESLPCNSSNLWNVVSTSQGPTLTWVWQGPGGAGVQESSLAACPHAAPFPTSAGVGRAPHALFHCHKHKRRNHMPPDTQNCLSPCLKYMQSFLSQALSLLNSTVAGELSQYKGGVVLLCAVSGVQCKL